MAADPEVSTTTVTGDPIVEEATRRFKRCADWESQARENFLQDYKFAHGDSDNGFQWPNRIRQNREVDAKPCLTMNVIRQHNLQIKNEAKQNKSSVAMRATGGGATKDSADMFEAIMRRIEYRSNAQAAYSTACGYQVDAGIGWWRIITQYEDEDSFDQEILISEIWDPLSVYMDMDCQKKDCSDAKYGFVFDLVPDGDLKDAYPGLEMDSLEPLGGGTSDDSWNLKDHTRVCEYFRKVMKRDRLVSFIDPGDGLRKEVRRSKLPKEVYEAVMAQPLTKWRPTEDAEVQWFLIVGQRVVDKTVWPGKYIPLIRVIGEETIIKGKLDRKGHTRAMKDAQRMYNYNNSAQVELVALQGKTPWMAAAKAIEEYESMWNTANVVNHSVMIWNHIDDEGNPVPPPQRQEPPKDSQAYQAGMETAFNQMMMTSGQWQNQMGMGGNERTGEAISRRQEQSYTAVFHFQDNYAEALKFTGKQIIELIPKIYDTKRLMMLKSDDGEDFNLELDPAARQVYAQQLDRDNKVVRRVLNPQMGKYDVESDVGPAYGTRREKTVRAMTLLLTQAPALTNIIGDLLLASMDFKEAQEAAQRLKRMVPPQALGTGPSQQEQAAQQQVVSLRGALAKALETTAKDKLKLSGKEELRDIDVYKAETDRMAALAKQLPQDADGLAAVIHQLVQDSLEAHLTPIVKANASSIGDGGGAALPETPPMPGATKAPDGQWYIKDPARQGKYLKVAQRTSP